MQKKCIIIIKRVTMCRVPKGRHIINKSVFLCKECPYRQLISLEAETADHTTASTGNERFVTIILASEDIGDVDLDLRRRDSEESIAKGHGGVAVTTKVDDETIGSETHLLDAVDKLTFYITLVITNFHIREHLAETVNNLFHGGGAINLGLATAGKVKVWTINDSYFFHVNNVFR